MKLFVTRIRSYVVCTPTTPKPVIIRRIISEADLTYQILSVRYSRTSLPQTCWMIVHFPKTLLLLHLNLYQIILFEIFVLIIILTNSNFAFICLSNQSYIRSKFLVIHIFLLDVLRIATLCHVLKWRSNKVAIIFYNLGMFNKLWNLCLVISMVNFCIILVFYACCVVCKNT